MHKHTSVHPHKTPLQRTHTAVEQPVVHQHPLVSLQNIIGNQAVQRLLIQRAEQAQEESPRERAEHYLRAQLEQQDKEITRTFNQIEDAMTPEESTRKVPLIEHVKMIHAATGSLTRFMLDTLYQAIMPVHHEYVERLFYNLRKAIEYKEEMVEGLDNPWEWYMKNEERFLERERVRQINIGNG